MHQMELYDDEPFNFEMIHNRYLKFAKQSKFSVKLSERPVILKAFERIQVTEMKYTFLHRQKVCRCLFDSSLQSVNNNSKLFKNEIKVVSTINKSISQLLFCRQEKEVTGSISPLDPLNILISVVNSS